MVSKEIDTSLHENRILTPAPEFSKNASLKTLSEYEDLYQQSIQDPESFWSDQAKQNLHWFKTWDGKTCEYDFTTLGQKEGSYLKYFSGGTLNASYNCLDRHLDTWRRNKAAIIWQGEREEDKRTLTYQQLHTEVSRFANVLKKHGVTQDSTVTIFLPMIPELSIAMLACARLGAIHSVVFSAFSADSLKNRILDCNSDLVITADVGFHAGKTIFLKAKVDEALHSCEHVKKVIVYNRGDESVNMSSGRDLWWHKEINSEDVTCDCKASELDSEHPLFILYTSGSTGKPKGVLHTTAGYLLYTHLSFKHIFDHKDEDVYWCTADIGWITGHSYIVYGPLSNGATCLMFEGVPSYPQPNRFWKIISDYKVNVFYTAPTALRALMRLGDSWPNSHDLSSLRLLGSVGEPINPEAWIWYYRVIGNERCPIVDTWWQTETGGIMISTLPGAMPMKPSSAGKPFFGIVPKILSDNSAPAEVGHGGTLIIEKPWPGMIRGVYGDKKNELVRKVYFSKFPGNFFTGDGCRVDEDGYYWLLGRIDDVINVSAHRFATAEIESALVAHESVTEAAVVGFPHETKGQGIYCFVTLKSGITSSAELQKELKEHVRTDISPIATPERIHFTEALPKTRSGKIMRRILRHVASGELDKIGDTSTLADPSVVDALINSRATT